MEPPADLALVARLAVRLIADGHGLAVAGRVLGLPPQEVDKALRAAVRAAGHPAPPPSAGREALVAAAAPLVLAASTEPGRPSTVCPPRQVTRAAWHGALDGPLLLATAEHLADCRACREGAAATAPPGEAVPGDELSEPGRRGGCLAGLLLLAAAGGLASLAALAGAVAFVDRSG